MLAQQDDGAGHGDGGDVVQRGGRFQRRLQHRAAQERLAQTDDERLLDRHAAGRDLLVIPHDEQLPAAHHDGQGGDVRLARLVDDDQIEGSELARKLLGDAPFGQDPARHRRRGLQCRLADRAPAAVGRLAGAGAEFAHRQAEARQRRRHSRGYAALQPQERGDADHVAHDGPLFALQRGVADGQVGDGSPARDAADVAGGARPLPGLRPRGGCQRVARVRAIEQQPRRPSRRAARGDAAGDGLEPLAQRAQPVQPPGLREDALPSLGELPRLDGGAAERGPDLVQRGVERQRRVRGHGSETPRDVARVGAALLLEMARQRLAHRADFAVEDDAAGVHPEREQGAENPHPIRGLQVEVVHPLHQATEPQEFRPAIGPGRGQGREADRGRRRRPAAEEPVRALLPSAVVARQAPGGGIPGRPRLDPHRVDPGLERRLAERQDAERLASVGQGVDGGIERRVAGLDAGGFHAAQCELAAGEGEPDPLLAERAHGGLGGGVGVSRPQQHPVEIDDPVVLGDVGAPFPEPVEPFEERAGIVGRGAARRDARQLAALLTVLRDLLAREGVMRGEQARNVRQGVGAR